MIYKYNEYIIEMKQDKYLTSINLKMYVNTLLPINTNIILNMSGDYGLNVKVHNNYDGRSSKILFYCGYYEGKYEFILDKEAKTYVFDDFQELKNYIKSYFNSYYDNLKEVDLYFIPVLDTDKFSNFIYNYLLDNPKLISSVYEYLNDETKIKVEHLKNANNFDLI